MTRLPRQLFETALPGLGRPLRDEEGESICNYLKLLAKWQKAHRLVGSTDALWLVENVVLDSVAFLGAVPREASRIADVGSGAGIPGVPIAIVRPELALTLIEARQRRVSFLSTVCRELGLGNVAILPSRLESLAGDYADTFDAVVMRCAGDVDALLPFVLRLVRSGGAAVVASNPSGAVPAGAERVTVPSAYGKSRTLDRFVKRDFR